VTSTFSFDYFSHTASDSSQLSRDGYRLPEFAIVLPENEWKSDIEPACKWKGCKSAFDTIQLLVKHVYDDHIGDKKEFYLCEWEACPRRGKLFEKRHKILPHLRTHTGEKPFMCPVTNCKKTFSRSDSVITHLKSHKEINFRMKNKVKVEESDSEYDDDVVDEAIDRLLAEIYGENRSLTSVL